LSTLTTPHTDVVTTEETDNQEPWQVVVLDDQVNTVDYVIFVFVKVFGLTKKKSEEHTMEVHHKGESILWSGSKEKAELYVQQLLGWKLNAKLRQ
jgi:ATP-dependent Clp protease adaptor protein ClpS